MKNETLDRLRLPSAWIMVGAVGALMLAGLIGLIAGSSGLYGSFPAAMTSSGGRFFGAEVILLLIGAVALVLTGERSRYSALPVIVATMIMTGVGLLFVLVNVITVFVANSEEIAHGFAGFLSTGAHGAVLGVFGFFLLKVFNDPTLVPRPSQQAGQHNPQQFPPATGAHQTFAGASYPQTTDQSAQQGYDASAYGQQGYGQDAAAQQQAYGTGAQQAYDASAYGQQQGYDQSQYAPQGTDQTQQAGTGEQAAQDAIQYGWYQGAEQQGTDTPSGSGVDSFFNSGENADTDTSGQGGSAYGSQYGSDAEYGSDQQGQYGTGGQQGWSGGEDNR